VVDLSNGDVAADSYHKYKEDIELLKDLGVSTQSFITFLEFSYFTCVISTEIFKLKTYRMKQGN
jgi:hypothetical protein